MAWKAGYRDSRLGDTSTLKTNSKEIVSSLNETYDKFNEDSIKASSYKSPLTNWRQAVQLAINEASNQGKNVVLPPLTLVFDAPVTLKSNVNIIGQKGRTIVTATTQMVSAFVNGSVLLENVHFYGVTFIGGVVDEGQEVPKRERVTNPSFSHAIRVSGDLVVGETNLVVKNIAVRDCEFKNIASLPVFMRGVRGYSEITHTLFDNNLDVGWVFCERVICSDNKAFRSADNGFSISRGNWNVTCTDNTVDLACYAGIWLAGWENPYPSDTSVSYIGARIFTCTGNVVTRSGQFGIKLTDAPMYGTVTGNTIHTVYRGNSDQPENNAGIGISVAGFPYLSTPATPVTYALGLNIGDNTIILAQRGGVKVMGAEYITIQNNLILDVGTEFYEVDSAQPTPNTAIGSANKDQNFGIALDNKFGNTIKRVIVKNNTIGDTRAVPFVNYPLVATATNNCEFKGNRSFNTRNSLISGLTQDSGRTNIFENEVSALASSNNNAVIYADTEGYKRLGFLKRTGQNPQIAFSETMTGLDFVTVDKQNIDDSTATYKRKFTFYKEGYFFVGNGYLWFDSTGALRKKSGTVPPTSETDGTII